MGIGGFSELTENLLLLLIFNYQLFAVHNSLSITPCELSIVITHRYIYDI
jgi:hypothetical protein